MSFSDDAYVCENCGYPAMNKGGIFRNNKSPFEESLKCFGCGKDTPNIITKKEYETIPIPKCTNCENDTFYLLKVNFGPPIAFEGGPTTCSGVQLGPTQNIGDYLLGVCSKCDMCIIKKATYWHVN